MAVGTNTAETKRSSVAQRRGRRPRRLFEQSVDSKPSNTLTGALPPSFIIDPIGAFAGPAQTIVGHFVLFFTQMLNKALPKDAAMPTLTNEERVAEAFCELRRRAVSDPVAREKLARAVELLEIGR